MNKFTSALFALTVSASIASPARADWWHRWFGTTAYYAPAACGQVVNYVPQTNYRTVYMPTAVTTYSPVSACNACGGATTVMRPVTTIVTQPRLVPYTSYLPVAPACNTCVAPVAVAPACNTCAAAMPVAPVTTAAYMAPAPAPIAPPPAPACCGAGMPPAMTAPAPVGQPMLGPPPTNGPPQTNPGGPGTVIRSLAPNPTYGNAGGPATTQPSLRPTTPQTVPAESPPDDSAPSRTFDDSEPSTNERSESRPESRLVIPPRTEPSSNRSPARALDPEGVDRYTDTPTRPTWSVQTASIVLPVTAAPPVEKTQSLGSAGWRAAQR